MVIKNEITMGHARAISKLESQNEMINLANQIVNEKLPVREVEKISQKEEVHKRVEQKRKTESTNEYKYVEDMLRDKLDTKVKIKDNKIEICFNNVNDLNRILEILDVKE